MKLFLVLIFLLLPCLAEAQVLRIDLSKATMDWTWTQGTGGVADGFRFACGGATGAYTTVTDLLGATVRSVAVSKVIKGTGTWFCVVSAYNSFGESTPSNEVNFIAGVSPSGSPTLSPPK